MKVYAKIEMDEGSVGSPMLSICFICEDKRFYCEFIENMDIEVLSESAISVYQLSLVGTNQTSIPSTENTKFFVGTTKECMDEIALFFNSYTDGSLQLVIEGMDQFYQIARIIDRTAKNKFKLERSIDINQSISTIYSLSIKESIDMPRGLIVGREVGVGRNAMAGAINISRLHALLERHKVKDTLKEDILNKLLTKLNNELATNPVSLFSFFENQAITVSERDILLREYLESPQKKCASSDYVGYLLTYIFGERIVLDADCVQKGGGRVINRVFIDG